MCSARSFSSDAEVFFQSLVFGFGGAARPGAGDGMDGDRSVHDLHQQLRRSADDLEAVQVQVVHVRGRVDGAQLPVYLERVRGGAARHSLGYDGLYHVSGDDVLARLVHHVLVVFARHVEFGRGVSLAVEIRFRNLNRLSEPGDHVFDA